MSTFLLQSVVALIWLLAIFCLLVWRHAATVRRAQQPGRPTEDTSPGNETLRVRTSDILAGALREHGDLFRETPVVAATWLFFIAVVFKLAVAQPVEAALLVGMAAVVRRYSRKRFAREFSERLRTRLLAAE